MNNGKVLKNTPPAVKLGVALERYAAHELGRIAFEAKVSERQMGNAWGGRPVETSAFLRICAAINYDPSPHLRQPTTIEKDGVFDFILFAVGLRVTRSLKHHTDREAATEMDIGSASVSRLEHGDPMSVNIVMRACGYVGVHPFAYLHSKILQKEAVKIAKAHTVSREKEEVSSS